MTTHTPEQQLRAILAAARVRVNNARIDHDKARQAAVLAEATFYAAQAALDDMQAMAPEPKPKADALTEDQRELLEQVTDKNRHRGTAYCTEENYVLVVGIDRDLWERVSNA